MVRSRSWEQIVLAEIQVLRISRNLVGTKNFFLVSDFFFHNPIPLAVASKHIAAERAGGRRESNNRNGPEQSVYSGFESQKLYFLKDWIKEIIRAKQSI